MSWLLTYEPLTDWPYPPESRVTTPFSAKWPATRDLLVEECLHLGAGHRGAGVVVVELDLQRADLRQDGQIRANANLASPRVRVSFDSNHGPMRYACDRYLSGWGDRGGPAWRHNVRAIALTLQALRAVDRYGAVHDGQQYSGFLAIEAGSNGVFASADAALRWLRRMAGAGHEQSPPKSAYRAAARRLHPDVGGDPQEWHRLNEAARLLLLAGL